MSVRKQSGQAAGCCLCRTPFAGMRRLSNYQHHIHNEKNVYREKCNFYLVRWKTRRWSFCAISHLLKTGRGQGVVIIQICK